MTEQETEELAAPPQRVEPAEVPPRARRWRGLTGSLTAGLVVLTVVVLGSGALSLFTTINGPGWFSVAGHVIAAVLAVLAQRVADRRTGRLAALAGFAVVAIVIATVWILWWG